MATDTPKTVNAVKALLKAYLDKRHWQYSRLSVTKYAPGVVTVHGWPSMQGCGAVAAGYKAEHWYKLSLYAESLGVRLRKFGER